MNTVDDEWSRFSKAVMPPGASPVQRQEMRRAFFAGAVSMFRMMERISAEMSEHAAMQVMQGFEEEFQLHVKAMMEGKA